MKILQALKDLMETLGSPNLDCRTDGAHVDPSVRTSYLFNSTIAGIDEADALLIVGSNPRLEAPIINARIRQRWLQGGFKAALIGEQTDLTFPYDYLGAGPDTLKDVAAGSHSFADVLKDAERPMIIVGMGALAREDGAAVLALAKQIADATGMVSDDWNGFNVLHTAAGRVGALDLGFVPGEGGRNTQAILAGAESGDVETVFLLNADEIDTEKLAKAFVIYQGSHGDAGVKHADVILPGAAYTEKNATWVNTEGRVQRGRKAVPPPGDAREDWTILRALSDVIGSTLPYNNIQQLRSRVSGLAPHFDALDEVAPAEWGDFGVDGDITADPFISPIADHYLTNPICRASDTMAACAAVGHGAEPQEATGTDG